MIVGSIYMFAGSVVPSGFLFCDGTAVSRDTYSDLFSVIGDMYGAGDGVSTFNLPTLSGKVIVGSGNLYSVGQFGGEETHSLNIGEIPSHLHVVPAHYHGNTFNISTPLLSHTVGQPAYTYASPNGTLSASGTSGTAAYNGISSATASRTRDLSITDHPATDCTVNCIVGDCGPMDTESSGEGEGHSNMQPFLTLNYIIYTGQ